MRDTAKAKGLYGRILAAVTPPPDRFLTGAGFRALFDTAQRVSSGGGDVFINLRSKWTGNVRWARSEIISSGDTTDHGITIVRTIRGAVGFSTTNRIDEAAIRQCVQRAETRLRYDKLFLDAPPPRAGEQYDIANLWSDHTANLDAGIRAEIQRKLVGPAVAEDLLAAGYLEVTAIGNGVVNSGGLFEYVPQTRAEYSVTVRNRKGNASGWAGVDNLDWNKIDAEKLSAVALMKCKKSADPVAIEPGRYTVILEPQAVADILFPLVGSLNRKDAEQGQGPWANRPENAPAPGIMAGAGGMGYVGGTMGMSRIGQKVLDPRFTLGADPQDPEMPFVPFAGDGTPHRAVKWFENGVLKALAYDRTYALSVLNKPDPQNNSLAFRMEGGPSSVEEMIASTERGLLVTRFVNVHVLDITTLLSAGNTSDGLWLIENGKITTPVKNFRIRESPVFAFNNLEMLGTPQRVLMREPAIVPPVKIRDFSMSSLADAV